MRDDDKAKEIFYRWLVDVQGVNPEHSEMRAFRRSIDCGSVEIVERVREMSSVKSLSGLYKFSA